MISEFRKYLVDKLKEAGIKTEIHTNMKSLCSSNESHIGSVIFDGDKFEKDSLRTIYIDKNNQKKKRTKKLKRSTSFVVTIGEYSMDKCELIFENFICILDENINIDGNSTPIEIIDADWVEKEDSILKSKVAVQIKIVFESGIYKDTGFIKINNAKIEDVEIEVK